MKSPMAVRIETTWSEAEKKIARKAFDRAFERQCTTITEKAKRMLATSSPPHGIWQVHDYLSRERKKVGQTYDYRYSVLISVFAELLRQGWLKRADLAGHTNDAWIVVVKGAYLYKDDAGENRLGPGDFLRVPGEEPLERRRCETGGAVL